MALLQYDTKEFNMYILSFYVGFLCLSCAMLSSSICISARICSPTVCADEIYTILQQTTLYLFRRCAQYWRQMINSTTSVTKNLINSLTLITI